MKYCFKIGQYIKRCFMLVILFFSTHSFGNDTLSVVSDVDLNRYVGTWYEIASYPRFFQKGCDRSEARYSLNKKGHVSVLNLCFKNERIYKSIKGEARVIDQKENSKLVVDFGYFRKGKYWVISLDKDYQWAVVSEPKRKSLFILARTKRLAEDTLNKILSDLEARGFDKSKIIYDKYPAETNEVIVKSEMSKKIIEMYNKFDGKDLSILDGFYSEDVQFIDPVAHVKGLKNLKAYYSDMYKSVESISFEFTRFIEDQNTKVISAEWIMTITSKKLNSAKPYDVMGSSIFILNKNNEIEYHRDYVDLGEMIYEKVPVLGFVIKKLKKSLEH